MRVGDTVPEEGTIFDWDVAEILERPSIEVSDIRDWDVKLERKRRDRHYSDLKQSILTHGFLRPVTAHRLNGELQYCDGHHRLAAAVELGLTTIPVRVFASWAIADDSGIWKSSDPLDKVRDMGVC
jgi:hypothetical protein